MAKQIVPAEFKEFLRLLNSKQVDYLVIGGYAVGHYGYVRTTNDIDIWIEDSPDNAAKMVQVMRDFGFSSTAVNVEQFRGANKIARIGYPPLRIEILTSISGVQFAPCHANRVVHDVDGIEVTLISLEDLKKNKAASGRPKDLNDLQNLRD